MIITFRVIPNIVRKLLILTWFWRFDLVENMLNDVVVPFLFKYVKRYKTWFLDVQWMWKKFLGTLHAILYKIKRTDFLGQIEPTYLQNG